MLSDLEYHTCLGEAKECRIAAKILVLSAFWSTFRRISFWKSFWGPQKPFQKEILGSAPESVLDPILGRYSRISHASPSHDIRNLNAQTCLFETRLIVLLISRNFEFEKFLTPREPIISLCDSFTECSTQFTV